MKFSLPLLSKNQLYFNFLCFFIRFYLTYNFRVPCSLFCSFFNDVRFFSIFLWIFFLNNSLGFSTYNYNALFS